jgi:hypothetical protein
MRRGLLLFVSLGLLSTLVGCGHRCQGVCDCAVQPIDHLTPSPLVKPAFPIGDSVHPAPAVNSAAAPVVVP